MKKDKRDLENKASGGQGNWDIAHNHRTEGQKEENIKPEEMDKEETDRVAKSKIDEKGYVKSLGYQDIAPEGNDPAKNEQMKAPDDESNKNKK